MTESRRSSDKVGIAKVTCWTASRLMEFWDWIDKRDIDKHVTFFIILGMTWNLTTWAQDYAALNPTKDGMDLGIVIAAVTAPFIALQGAALKWYYDARSS